MNVRLILFEMLIGGLAVLPALSVWHWPAEVPFPAWEAIFAYLAGNAWFYFLAAWFHFQDRQKPTYPLMAPTIEAIRLIWAGYFFFLGCVLFVFPRYWGAIDTPRLLGVGLWRRRRWAAWGLTALAVVDLAVLALTPQTFYAYLVDSELFAFSVVLSAVVLVSGGPLGALLILAGLPSMLRNTSR